MQFRQDDERAPVSDGPDTRRLAVSDQQWLAVLDDVQRGEPIDLDPMLNRRLDLREPCAMRCLLRLANQETYIVRSRDISAGGLRFVHGQPLRPGTRCTIALQPQHGLGRIMSASVAWCKEIAFTDPDIEGYDVGINFDTPIDTHPFTGGAA